MPDRPRENAICLYETDFSETSQVVHFLGRQSGVVHMVAKGSKRAKSPTGGPVDLLVEGQLVFIRPRGEGMGTLVEFSPVTHHMPLRSRLADLNAALYMVEITRALLAEHDPHPPVFDLLSAALARLDRPGAPTQAVLAYFQWRLLRHVGLLGQMGQCVNCNGPAEGAGAYFTSREGGLLCRNCESAWTEKQPVAPAAIKALNALRAMDRRQKATLDESAAQAVNDLLAYHIAYQLGRPLKMLRHIRAR